MERGKERGERERERERERNLFYSYIMYEGLKLARPTNVSREIVIHH